MTSPLALVFYENLVLGSQLVNRLQDLGYRVHTATAVANLPDQARQEKPLLILTELESRNGNVCAAIKRIRKEPDTKHIPVLAFFGQHNQEAQTAARDSGVNLVAYQEGIIHQLPQLLDHLLEIP